MNRRAIVLSAAFSLVVPATAFAGDKDTCLSAADQGDRLKHEGKLTAAKKQFLVCAQADCPAKLTPECVNAVAEIDASLPSLVVEVRDATGSDTKRVRVYCDGEILTEQLDGTAIPLDPGVHRLRFELPSGAASEQEALIRIGEKNRKILIAFPLNRPSVVPAMAETPKPNRTAAVIAFSAGGAGIVLGVVTGVVALLEKGVLDRDCPTKVGCPPQDSRTRDTMSTMSNLSTAGFVAGGVGLGLGTVFWLAASKKPVNQASPRIQASLGIFAGGISGTF